MPKPYSINILFSKTGQEIPDKKVQKIFKLIPHGYREKLNRYKDRNAIQESLLGIMLLSKGLRTYGISLERLKGLKKDDKGKPFIDNCIDFNISHSYGITICGFSDKGPLGIDIEKIKPIGLNDYKNIMPVRIYKQSKEDISCFYQFWTRSESVLKADGRGLGVPLNKVKWNGNQAKLSNNHWYVKKVNVDKDYECHIAIPERRVNPSCKEVVFGSK